MSPPKHRGIPRISYDEARRFVLDDLDRIRVIIPARNEADTIGHVLEYLTDLGLEWHQIMVVVNGEGKKETMEAADKRGMARVIDFDDYVAEGLSRFGISGDSFRGKGAAMLLGTMLLGQESRMRDSTPVVFMDADLRLGNRFLRNTYAMKRGERMDPITRLVGAMDHLSAKQNEPVQLVKPAACGISIRGSGCGWSHDSNQVSLRGFLTTNSRYNPLAAFQWPTSGLVCIRYGLLKKLRFATGFAVDTALLMSAWDKCKGHSAFGEVELGGKIVHRATTDDERDFMAWQIGMFMHRAESTALTELTHGKVSYWNRENRRKAVYWSRDASKDDEDSQRSTLPVFVPEERMFDALLPSPNELREFGGLSRISH